MKTKNREIFCFTIDHQQLAIPLANVVRVVMACEVSTVPNAPPVIHGIINLHGTVVPVINVRQRLKMKLQPIHPQDLFIIADTRERRIALVADKVSGLRMAAEKETVTGRDVDKGFDAAGIFMSDDGLILIYDLELFLSAEEEIALMEEIEKLGL